MSKGISSSFYINLRNIMEEQNVTLDWISSKTSIHRSTLYTYWSNDRIPTRDHLMAISSVLKCRPSDLLPSYRTLCDESEYQSHQKLYDELKNHQLDKIFNLHNFIDECIAKKDRYVSIFISPHGTTVSVYPLAEDESD